MKNPFILLVLIAVLGCIGVTSYKQTKGFQRTRYEAMLRNEFRNIPVGQKGDKEIRAFDQPEMAAIQDYFMTIDPATGTVPRERLLLAYEAMKNNQYLKSSAAPQWNGYPVEMGGRTRTIMYDPNDPTHKKVWAGAVTGGLWYNPDITDPSSSWVSIGDFWSCLAVHSITYDPNNPMIFYVGTGEPETAIQTYRESSGLGDGIWKSTDGGQTWNRMNSTSGFAYITKILVKNEGGNSVIYAGVVSGIYHGIHQSAPSDGLFRSADGGNTWTQVLPDIPGFTVPFSPSDIVMGADGRIYVGTMPNMESQGGATLMFSDSGLPGSWTVNSTYKTIIELDPDYPIPGRVVLATAPSNPSVVYGLIGSGFLNSANNFNYFYCFHIIRSNDKGVSWIDKNLPFDLTSGVSFATIAWHALDIVVDPNNAENLFIGGLDVHHSTSGGDTWTRVSNWSLMSNGGGPQYVHADQHTMVFKPGSSNELLLGSDGGVFFTSNATATSPVFAQRNTNYATLQYYSADIKNLPGDVSILGGLQDNGSLLYEGYPISINSMISGGDGAYCFFDKNEPDFYMSSVYYNVWYIFAADTMINYLDNWQSGVFVNPADYDFRNNTLYANSCDFIGTRADYYSKISNVTTGASGTFKKANTNATTFFSAVKWSPYSPTNKTTIFLGTQSGKLFKLTSAESTPVTTEITGSGFPVGSISCIDIGNSDNELLVTFSNYGVASVWYTNDGGLSWKNKDTNLPDMPVRWGIFHPGNRRQVMLATETGTWTTANFDQDDVVWSQSVNGMANVRTDMLNMRESDYTVVAATHGRGLFTTTWDVVDAISDLTLSDLRIYPNPVSDALTLHYHTTSTQRITIKVFDQTGKQLFLKEKNSLSGLNQERINLTGKASGVYYVTLYFNGKMVKTEKVVKE